MIEVESLRKPDGAGRGADNARGRFGPPAWAQARFVLVQEIQQIEIEFA